MADLLNHAGLVAWAKKLGRPLETVTVLKYDPFVADAPGRRANAEWFSHKWTLLGGASHLRAFHYKLVSQKTPVLMPSGKNYENTEKDEAVLLRASGDARFLDLVPADIFEDRRNELPIWNDAPVATDAWLGVNQSEMTTFQLPKLPQLGIEVPVIAQRYLVAIIIEKTTMDHFLIPLCERYNVAFFRGPGEQSITRCVELVKRAVKLGLPVRILYISDFDPGGRSMPTAVARKVEHELYKQGISGFDLQVRSIALTPEQCIQYDLPRTPIKEGEGRAKKFQARFGRGATELDALETLHPGELERIVTREIKRYHDDDLDDAIADIADEKQDDLDRITKQVHKKHASEIAKLKAERTKLQAAIKAYTKSTKPILKKIEFDLLVEAPDIESIDWPEPAEGDEDDEALFELDA